MIRFFDLETRGKHNLGKVGLDNYALGLDDITLVTWRDGIDGITYAWEPLYDEVPDDLKHPPADTIWAAWNSRFDRTVWNSMCEDYGLPRLEVNEVIDVAAMARAMLLPSKLDHAARALRIEGKKPSAAMLQIADNSTPLPVDDDPIWDEFIEYGIQDVDAMVEIWQACRELSQEEWSDFIVSEIINDRGMAIDTELAAAVVPLAEAEKEGLNDELRRLIGDPEIKLTHSKRLVEWVYRQIKLDEGVRNTMVVERPTEDEPEAPFRLSLNTKKVLPVLTDALHQSPVPVDPVLLDVLDLLSYGRGSVSKKFQKMVDQVGLDDRVRGSYVFNGAGQTGRFSSWGIQMHNLARDKPAEGLTEAVLSMCRRDRKYDDYPVEDQLATLRNDYPDKPLIKQLAGLVRSCIVAPEGRVLVWGDWSAIEARITPWLADSRTADTVLDQYAAGVDRYVVNAMDAFNVAHPEDVTDDQRQAGKIAELSLIFGGSVNAYIGMARGYGLRVPVDFADRVVRAWRDANPWARRFWNELYAAACQAVKRPGTTHRAGRIRYTCVNGHLWAILPDGRPLMYPDAKLDWEKDEKTQRRRETLTYRHDNSRRTLWYGKLAENVTQATAASLLRRCLGLVHDIAVGHTHDEIITECAESNAADQINRLRRAMLDVPPWGDGLPLDCEITSDWYYHK